MNGGSITKNTALSVEEEPTGAGALYAKACYSLTINSRDNSNNEGTLSGIILENMNNNSDIKKFSKDPAISNSIYAINGGSISNNGGLIPGILIKGNNKLKMSGDTVITGGDSITLLDSCISGVEITGPLIGVGPITSISITKFDDINNTYSPNFPIGMQVLYSSPNYSFVAEDLARFSLANSDYGINNMGKVGTVIKEDWVEISGDANLSYNGSAKTVDILVGDGISTLVRGVDYTVSYRNNINVGTATVIITGIGNYVGGIEKDFRTTTKKSIIIIDKKTGKAIAKSKGTDYVFAKIGDISMKLKVVVK